MMQQFKTINFGPLLIKAGLPLGIFGLCISYLTPHLTPTVVAGFSNQLGEISYSAWAIAIALTMISFWSVGRYDGVAHQHFATRIPQPQARMSGTISIALAQTMGFGLATGALARWRMMGDVSFTTALKLSAFVSLSFMVCWAIVTAICCLIFTAPTWTFFPSIAVLTICPIATFAMFRWPQYAPGGVCLPNLKSWGSILFWTAIDTSAAAGVLFILLPENAGLSFPLFLPLFLLALGSALLSNTPGGVGPFELMLLGLLPQIPAGEVLGSSIAFRFVYYAVPASIALIALARPFKSAKTVQIRGARTLAVPQQGEIQVIKQNGGGVLNASTGSCAVWPTQQCLVALCNPLSGAMRDTLRALKAEANTLGKHPFVYKCSGKNAV